MEIYTYKDNARNKTIFKIEVDNNIEDFEEARDLMFSGLWESLQKFRAFEQELGIPLEVLFKALKGFYYINHDGQIDYMNTPRLFYSENCECYCFREGIFLYEDIIDVKKHGKTWWLEKPKEEVSD